MIPVYLGLGSNLDNPVRQLDQAIALIQQEQAIQWRQISSYYQSSPMGPQDQPDYINAVAYIETELSAEALLDRLQSIEYQQGRVRQQRWGARTLDLDILLYGDQEITTERLNIPHIGLHQRAFVLYPLYEIAPELMIPGKGVVAELLDCCTQGGLRKID